MRPMMAMSGIMHLRVCSCVGPIVSWHLVALSVAKLQPWPLELRWFGKDCRQSEGWPNRSQRRGKGAWQKARPCVKLGSNWIKESHRGETLDEGATIPSAVACKVLAADSPRSVHLTPSRAPAGSCVLRFWP